MANAIANTPEPYRIAIVGGAVSALACINNLLKPGRPLPAMLPLEIEIIEASDEFARGLAWSKKNVRPFHRINSYDRPDREPRGRYGDGFDRQFNDAVAELRRRGVKVKLTSNTTVTDLQKHKDDEFTLTKRDSSGNEEKEKFHSAILAMGNWQSKTSLNENEGVFASPWPAENLEKNIDPNQTIGILGSSLTAIDTALTLAHNAGTFTPDGLGGIIFTKHEHAQEFGVKLYSNTGALPPVLGYESRAESRKDLYRTIRKQAFGGHGYIDLDKLFKLIKQDFLREAASQNDGYLPALKAKLSDDSLTLEKALESYYKLYDSKEPTLRLQGQIKEAQESLASKTPIFYQQYLSRIVDCIHDAYNEMGAEDQERFNKEVRPLYSKLIACMVLDNAKEIEALMKAGCLKVEALGKGYHIGTKHERDKKLPGIELSYKDEKYVVHHPVFVRAVGNEHAKLYNSSLLTKRMLKANIIQPMLTPFADQDEGARRYEEEGGKGKGATCLIDGIYAKSEGTIYINMQTGEAIPVHSEEKMPHQNIYPLGPLISSHYPLALSVPDISRQANIAIGTICKRVREHHKRNRSQEKILVWVQTPTKVGVVLAVCDMSYIPDDIGEELRISIANKHGLKPENVDLIRKNELPPFLQGAMSNTAPNAESHNV
jgi:hypothetical protein